MIKCLLLEIFQHFFLNWLMFHLFGKSQVELKVFSLKILPKITCEHWNFYRCFLNKDYFFCRSKRVNCDKLLQSFPPLYIYIPKMHVFMAIFELVYNKSKFHLFYLRELEFNSFIKFGSSVDQKHYNLLILFINLR